MENLFSKHPETLVKLIRSSSIFYIIIWYLLGCIFSSNFQYGDYRYLITLIGFFFTYSAGNVLNDYFDRDIDKSANKQRPIQTGDISVGDTLKAYFILVASGLFVSLFAGYVSFLSNLLVVLIGVLYSYPLFSFSKKGFSSTTLMILGYHVIPFITGYIQYEKSLVLDSAVVLFFFGFLFVRMSRLFMKDYEDDEADRLYDKITPLNILGHTKLFYLISIFTSIGVIMVCYSYSQLFYGTTQVLLNFLIIFYSLFTISTAYLSSDRKNTSNIKKYRRYGHLCILVTCVIILFH